ncbi:MAG: hypothetical protein ACFFKA_21115, partial [Candidatus Thorarchaeota archaeon]
MIYQVPQETITISIIFFIMVLLLNMGITIFFMNWGDRIQVVKHRSLFFLISLIPGIFFIGLEFLILFENFSNQFVVILSISVIISLISGIIIKQVSYTTIP